MIRILGSRGTLPVSGKEYVRYGGNTPCMMVPVNEDRCVIIDGGSGLYSLNRMNTFKEYDIFLTHIHWDHIMGMPIFSSFFRPDKKVNLYIEEKSEKIEGDILDVLFNPPFFPVPRSMLRADINFHTIKGQEVFTFDDLTLTASKGNHPNGVLMFKFERGDNTVVLASDYEHGSSTDEFLVEFARGADHLIYDTTYLPDDFEGKRDGVPKTGWGHSTYVVGAELAKKAKVKNLVLFHHHPDYTDDMIDNLEKRAKKLFKGSVAAYDGMEIPL